MTAPYRLYGAALSPYSLKVRAYLDYKGVAYEWLNRSQARQEEFQRYAKLPLIPVVVGADESVLQDSTPIIEALEAAHPEPPLEPREASLSFLSALLEDYADEWLNKAMFHYRWSYEPDQNSAAARIVEGMFEGGEPPNRDAIESAVRDRMIGRLRHVGSNAETGPIIEASLLRLADALEAVLAARPYLFGARPALADFGLAAQLQQLLSDPTPGALLRARAPRVSAWAEKMRSPRAEGDFESFTSLAPAFAALVRSEIGETYLPWMEANADAVANEANTLTVTLAGQAFSQSPQRYAAKALAEIRRKRALVEDEALTAFLADAGCAAALAAPEDGGEDENGEGEEE